MSKLIGLSRTELALALLVTITPLVSYRIKLGPVPIDAVSFFVALVIVSYATNDFRKETRREPMPFTWAFLVFLFFAGVSAVVAPSTFESVSATIRFAGYFLLVLIIGRTIKTKEALNRMLYLMVFSGVLTGLAGVYGIYQFINAPVAQKTMFYQATADVMPRISSTFGNSNFYAEYLVILIPIGFALAFGSRKIAQRLVMSVATLFLFVILILTYTRGSWLATIVSIILMSVLTWGWLLWVWAVLYGAAWFLVPRVASRVLSIADIGGGSAGFRLRLWNIAEGIIRDHPIIGVGIGNFYTAFTTYVFAHPKASVGWVMYGAHNSYLTIWAETGIVGILSFVAIILISVKYGLYLSREKAKDRYLAWVNSAVLASVVGFSVNSVTSNSFYHPQAAVFFWVMLGLQISIYNLSAEKTQSKSAAVLEGSLLFYLFRGRAVKRAWQGSKVVEWIFKKPTAPDLLAGSRFCRPRNPHT